MSEVRVTNSHRQRTRTIHTTRSTIKIHFHPKQAEYSSTYFLSFLSSQHFFLSQFLTFLRQLVESMQLAAWRFELAYLFFTFFLLFLPSKVIFLTFFFLFLPSKVIFLTFFLLFLPSKVIFLTISLHFVDNSLNRSSELPCVSKTQISR